MEKLDKQTEYKLEALYEDYVGQFGPKLANRKDDYVPFHSSTNPTENLTYTPSLQDTLEDNIQNEINALFSKLSNFISDSKVPNHLSNNISEYLIDKNSEFQSLISKKYIQDHGATISTITINTIYIELNQIKYFFQKNTLQSFNEHSNKAFEDLLSSTETTLQEQQQDIPDFNTTQKISDEINAFENKILNDISLYLARELPSSNFDDFISEFQIAFKTFKESALSQIFSHLQNNTSQSYEHIMSVLAQRKSAILQAIFPDKVLDNNSSHDSPSEVTNTGISNSSPLVKAPFDDDPKPEPPTQPEIIDLFDPNYSTEEMNRFLDAQKYYYDVTLPEWYARHPELNPSNSKDSPKQNPDDKNRSNGNNKINSLQIHLIE